MPESRAVKFDEAGLQKQAELKSTMYPAKPKKSKSAGASSGGAGDSSRKRNRDPIGADDRNSSAIDLGMEEQDEFLKKLEIKLSIPDELKVKLVDDWEHITKNQKVLLIAFCPVVIVHC